MKLKRLMDENNGLTNAQIAKLTGYDESTISLLVRGKYHGNAAKLETDIISKLAVAILYSSSRNSLMALSQDSTRPAWAWSQSFIHQVRILSASMGATAFHVMRMLWSQSFIHQVRILSSQKS